MIACFLSLVWTLVVVDHLLINILILTWQDSQKINKQYKPSICVTMNNKLVVTAVAQFSENEAEILPHLLGTFNKNI